MVFIWRSLVITLNFVLLVLVLCLYCFLDILKHVHISYIWNHNFGIFAPWNTWCCYHNADVVVGNCFYFYFYFFILNIFVPIQSRKNKNNLIWKITRDFKKGWRKSLFISLKYVSCGKHQSRLIQLNLHRAQLIYMWMIAIFIRNPWFGLGISMMHFT